MEYGLHHIASATTTTLIPQYGSAGKLKSITVCNQHVSTTAVVSLYLFDGTNDSYIAKNLSIPAGVTLVVEDVVAFDNSVLGMKLTNTGGTPLSVIIK
tara:strand:+ start:82 stop:375 length:294 start_codon:yes stop_codon:yes gene_type:complete